MSEQGIDFVSGSSHGLQVGDRVTLTGHRVESNKHRHYVIAATCTAADLVERVRPSRGYARHVRRRKQRESKP